MAEWVRTYENGRDWMECLGGRAWGEGVRLPPRWHRCTAQTRASIKGELVARCDCGAMQFDGDGPWLKRNWTRGQARGKRREAALPRVGVVCGTCGKWYEAPEGSKLAAARLCTDCWMDQFLASGHS
jgi:hypothetical protein